MLYIYTNLNILSRKINFDRLDNFYKKLTPWNKINLNDVLLLLFKS